MTKPFAYLCGGIFGRSDAECVDWRATAGLLLRDSFEIIDPMARDYRGREEDCFREIVHGDLADIQKSSALLVNASRASWGTAMEVFHAYGLGKVVIAFAAPPVSPWLRYHTHGIAPAVESACQMVKEAFKK